MDQTRPLFVYFRPFLNTMTNVVLNFKYFARNLPTYVSRQTEEKLSSQTLPLKHVFLCVTPLFPPLVYVFLIYSFVCISFYFLNIPNKCQCSSIYFSLLYYYSLSVEACVYFSQIARFQLHLEKASKSSPMQFGQQIGQGIFNLIFQLNKQASSTRHGLVSRRIGNLFNTCCSFFSTGLTGLDSVALYIFLFGRIQSSQT